MSEQIPAAVTEQIQRIPLEQIHPSPGNRRVGGFNPERLQNLADSIKAMGVQMPAVVRQIRGDLYELVAGERRWRASKLAGLEDLPCVVRDLDDLAVLKIQTIENLQREDVHPLDEADGYARLIAEAGYDVKQLADEIGQSPSYVYQRLKLQALIPPARKLLEDGRIAAGHAILIARLQASQQKWAVEELARFGDDREYSVRSLDTWIHREVMRSLSKLPFKKDDADLVPDAGPCTTCPKRTGFNTELFADVCKSSDKGGRDSCSDPDCFNAKLDALVERQREKVGTEEYLEVVDTWLGVVERNLPDSVKTQYQWDECRKKDKDAVRCLVVAGAGRGRLTWGTARKTNRLGYPAQTPAEKARRKLQLKREREQKARYRQAWDRFTKGATTALADQELSEDLLRIVTRVFYGRLWNELRKQLCGLRGWGRPPKENYKNPWERPSWDTVGLEKIAKMGAAELRVFLLECALVHTSIDHTSDLTDAADLVGIGAPVRLLLDPPSEESA